MAGNAKFLAWGRMIALMSGYLLVHCGIIDCFYPSLGIIVGCYSIIVGFGVWFFLYPFPYLGILLIVLEGPFRGFVVGAILLVISPFCCAAFPTMIPGFSLFCAGIVFILGGLKREKGMTIRELLRIWHI